MVNRWKVAEALLLGWLATLFTLCVALVFCGAACFLLVRTGGVRIVFLCLSSAGILGLFIFLFSEPLLVFLSGAHRLDQDTPEGLRVLRLLEEVCHRAHLSLPRLYRIPSEAPNACAFGIGMCRQYALGVTCGLCRFPDDELKAVLAHEVGHIIAGDVGLLSVLSVAFGAVARMGRHLAAGRMAGGWLPALLTSGFFFVLNRILFPFFHSTIAQEREYGADALGAYYVGSPQPLAAALQRLRREGKEDDRFHGLFQLHPTIPNRLAALNELTERGASSVVVAAIVLFCAVLTFVLSNILS